MKRENNFFFFFFKQLLQNCLDLWTIDIPTECQILFQQSHENKHFYNKKNLYPFGLPDENRCHRVIAQILLFSSFSPVQTIQTFSSRFESSDLGFVFGFYQENLSKIFCIQCPFI